MELGRAALVGAALALAGCLSGSDPRPAGAAGTLPFLAATDPVGDSPIFLDVVNGSIIESPSSLLVRIGLAQLDLEAVPTLLAAREHVMAVAELCWNDGADCAGVTFYPSGDVTAVGYYRSEFQGSNQDCSSDWWYWCDWKVPADVEEGSPGSVTLHVPREILSSSAAGSVLSKPFLQSWAVERDAILPASAAGQPTGSLTAVAFGCIVDHCVNEGWDPDGSVEVDRSNAGNDFTLHIPEEGALGRPSPSVVIVDNDHDVLNSIQGYRADLDILTVAIDETAEEIAFIVTVQSLPPDFRHGFEMEIGIHGTMYEVGYDAVLGNVIEPKAGHCVDRSCTDWKTIPVNVEVDSGTPGTVHVAIKWTDMVRAEPGDLIQLIDVAMNDGFAWIQRPGAVPGTYLYVYTNAGLDTVLHPEIYFLKVGAQG